MKSKFKKRVIISVQSIFKRIKPTYVFWEYIFIQNFSSKLLNFSFLTPTEYIEDCKLPYTCTFFARFYCTVNSKSLNFSITRCYTYHILTFGRLSVTFSISSPEVQISSAHEIIAFQSLHVTNIQHHLLSFILVLILWGAKSSDFI